MQAHAAQAAAVERIEAANAKQAAAEEKLKALTWQLKQRGIDI